RIGGYWRRITELGLAQTTTKLQLPPIPRVAGDHVKPQAMALRPPDHLPCQPQFGGKAAPRRYPLLPPQGRAGLGKSRLGQEPLAINQRPDSGGDISLTAAETELAEIDFAQVTL